MWFWLARSIRGRSQQVNTNKGVDKGSVARNWLDVAQPVSDVHLSHVRLTRAINRLCAVVVDHNHLGEVNQIVGNNIIVGTNTFNIAED